MENNGAPRLVPPPQKNLFFKVFFLFFVRKSLLKLLRWVAIMEGIGTVFENVGFVQIARHF
jgi:hypothetical protein